MVVLGFQPGRGGTAVFAHAVTRRSCSGRVPWPFQAPEGFGDSRWAAEASRCPRSLRPIMNPPGPLNTAATQVR